MSELTKETAQRLFDDAGKSIALCETDADQCAALLIALESKPKTNEFNALKGVLNTSLLIDFINLDLCSAFRQYVSTELSAKYDKRQAMTKINIVMSEGYKKIYGFGEKQRGNSYWAQQIKTVVDFLGGLDKEYKAIETELIAFGDNNILNKDMRNLAVHYDESPMKVYKMLLKLDAEEVSKRCIEFYNLINSIREFIHQLSNAMLLKVAGELNKTNRIFGTKD